MLCFLHREMVSIIAIVILIRSVFIEMKWQGFTDHRPGKHPILRPQHNEVVNSIDGSNPLYLLNNYRSTSLKANCQKWYNLTEVVLKYDDRCMRTGELKLGDRVKVVCESTDSIAMLFERKTGIIEEINPEKLDRRSQMDFGADGFYHDLFYGTGVA